MVKPAIISRKAFKEFEGERWNAFNNLIAMSEPDDLTPVQRVAHLAYWYYSEMMNGGHFQYFINQAVQDHGEVIEALHRIGATGEAEILSRACLKFEELVGQGLKSPESAEDYLDVEDEAELGVYDEDFFKTNDTGGFDDTILAKLVAYLDAHEAEFIEWVP